METPDRDTPTTFSREEVDEIRRMIATPETAIVCPRCGEELSTSLPIAGGGTMAAVWEVRCEQCHRSVVLSDRS